MQRIRYLGLKWRAMAFLALGARQLAARLFAQMAAEFPRDPYARASRAHLLGQDGHHQEALALMREVVELQPGNGTHWFNLGFLQEALERYDDAEAAFRRACELNPSLDRAWYGLALILIRQRRFDDAVLALKQNTRLQPMSPYGWYQLARVHVDRQEPEEARKIIQHLKRFEPKVAAQLERETGLTVPQAG